MYNFTNLNNMAAQQSNVTQAVPQSQTNLTKKSRIRKYDEAF